MICGFEFPEGVVCGQAYNHSGPHLRWEEYSLYRGIIREVECYLNPNQASELTLRILDFLRGAP